MIGIIQRVLMRTLENAGGEELCNRVMDRAGVERDRVFRIDMNYSDPECMALLAAAKEELGCTEEKLYEVYAETFVAQTRMIFPAFYSRCKNSEEFLNSQISIHALLGSSLRNKQEKQAITDKFQFVNSSPGKLSIRYASPNRLCGLYHALAHAVAESYGDRLTVETRICSKRRENDGACEFDVSWIEVNQPSSSDMPEDSNSKVLS